MKKTLGLAALALLFFAGQSAGVFAQEPSSDSHTQSSSAKAAKPAPKKESSVTQHTARINGQTIHRF